MTFALASTAFVVNEEIPERFTGAGDDVSPPLHWTDPPDRTESLAIIMEDPDAPGGMFTHWIVFNIPPVSRELSEGIRHEDSFANGVTQGRNDFGQIGYAGPAPPPGSKHRYVFGLYALDRRIELPAGATRQQLWDAMQLHILTVAELVGTYEVRVPAGRASA